MAKTRRTDFTYKLVAVTFSVTQKSSPTGGTATVKVEDILEFTNTYNCSAEMATMEYSDGERFETFAKSWYSGKSWRNPDFMVMGIDGYKLHPTVRIGLGAYGDGNVWRNPDASL